MRPWIVPFVAGAMAVALVAVSVAAVVQTRRLGEAHDRADELSREVSKLRADIRTLEAELEAARDGDLLGSLGDLLGGDSAGLLGELLGGGDLEGLLDELLGGAGGSSLLGDPDDVPGAACLLPDGDDLGGLFDGLLGDLLGGGADTADPTELVARIADEVAVLRELDWEEEPDVDFLDDRAVLERLDELITADLDRDALHAQERLLATIGAIPMGTDLDQVQRDLLDEQVAGFYVPETGELVVRVADGGDVRAVDQVVLAHELDHALTDQALGLPDLDEQPYTGDADAALAALAVVEGDASLLMNLWALEHLSLADQLSMALDPALAASQASLDDAPEYLQRELVYPYTDGLAWACQQYLDGGWDVIDAAYADPPATSAEVLWGEPIDPTPTATLATPTGYEELDTWTFGAAPLLWLFEAPGDDADRALEDARGRARAWSGGTATVWANGDATAVGLALVDGGTGTEPLCDSVGTWYGAAFPDARRIARGEMTLFRAISATAVLRCKGDDVMLGVAPDLTTATRIAGG